MNEIKDFINMSKYAGERFDLVQAGGGNSSVKKEDGTMIIKSSGFMLSEMDYNKGYSIVNNKFLLELFKNNNIRSMKRKERDVYAENYIKKAMLEPKTKASIEVLLHSLLRKYTLHIHPLVINSIVCRNDWKTVINEIFKDGLCITYQTPGIDLALEIYSEMKNIKQNGSIPKIFFLQSHGIIISSDEVSDIYILTDEVIQKFEKYVNVDYSKYKLTNKISKLINGIEDKGHIAYLSEDDIINRLLNTKKDYFFRGPLFPDKHVYCGIKALEIKDIDDSESIKDYLNSYYELPKVILFKGSVFFIAQSVKKSRDIEEVFKSHVLTIDNISDDNISYLDSDEIAYLGNWEAEKYRQNL